MLNCTAMKSTCGEKVAKKSLAVLLVACGGSTVASEVTGTDGGYDAALILDGSQADRGGADSGQPGDGSSRYDDVVFTDTAATLGGIIRCGTTTCSLRGQFCCEPPGGADGGAPFCAPSCPGQWGTVACEKAADCNASSFCCGGRGLNSSVNSSCLNTPCKSNGMDVAQLCESGSECTSGLCVANTSCARGRAVCGGAQIPSWCR